MVKILIGLLLCFSVMFAEWGSWANNQIRYTGDSGTSISTATRSGYTAGSIKVRWQPLGVIHPIQVTPPHFSAGCNGIDIS